MNASSDRWKYRLPGSICILALCALIISGCDRHPGFDQVSDGVWKKLVSFGDCEPRLSEAEYFLMDVSFKKSNSQDTGYTFLLHHHALKSSPTAGYSGDVPGLRLSGILDSMHCGDRIALILPFSEFDNTWLGAYADSSMYQPQDEMELQLHLIKTFDKKAYTSYLMQASQQGEISEADAIELLLMNDVQRDFEKHGQCFIQYFSNVDGDSILPGREISIRYNTYLLDGTRLDDTTSMQFNFGRPGQIIGGLQYALSLLQEGDDVMIYLPSSLAFGSEGSTGNVVPSNTPVYFRLKVEKVLSEDEKF